MKTMLSKQDIKQVREIVREEIREEIDSNEKIKKIDAIAISVANLQVEHEEMKETLHTVEGDVKKILSTMDSFIHKNERLEIEQTVQKSQLNRHQAWIKKADKKLKIGIAE